MTPNPILKVLSTMKKRDVPALLMGGQACILYGGAEFEIPEIGSVAALSLHDLVQSKKTQRDKDWPMIRRLIEADYLSRRPSATDADLLWWLTELRTPSYLMALVREREALRRSVRGRPWLAQAPLDEDVISAHLDEEEKAERRTDRDYWAPLKRELETLRRSRQGRP